MLGAMRGLLKLGDGAGARSNEGSALRIGAGARSPRNMGAGARSGRAEGAGIMLPPGERCGIMPLRGAASRPPRGGALRSDASRLRRGRGVP